LISEHEDVIPSKIWWTYKPNSDRVENAYAPSNLPEYVNLPLLADNYRNSIFHR